MPRLIVRGIPFESLCKWSGTLVDRLAIICDCGTDNFTIEYVNAVTIENGAAANHYPFIEVGWFDRGSEVKRKAAETITQLLREEGIPEVEIVFIAYDPKSYYINGEACG